MKPKLKWENCVSHRADVCEKFISEYFSTGSRRVLLVAGAGFDPRALHVAQRISKAAPSFVRVVLIREDRDDDGRDLHERAERNEEQFKSLFASHEVHHLTIFSHDTAVIGGRQAVAMLQGYEIGEYTDIVIDFSALSICVSFPITRYFLEAATKGRKQFNLHVMVAADPQVDVSIAATFSDAVIPIHGFKGDFELHESADSARLWMPQLAIEQKPALRRIFEVLQPHDTIPIVPFPARDPKASDRLLSEFSQELLRTWDVDPRNIIYAAEDDPVDMYRSIIYTDHARQAVFQNSGGANSVVSPVGSKVLAIGALMAALDRNLPLYYVEPVNYQVDWAATEKPAGMSCLVHVWLSGDVYA